MSPVFWLLIFMVPVITLLFDIGYRAYMTTVHTTEADKIRIAEITKKDVANYVDGCRYPNESSSLLRNMRNTFSKSKKRQQDQDDLEMNARYDLLILCFNV